MNKYSSYGIYRKARNASWECLLDCQVRSLPVNLTQIAAAQNIALCGYSSNEAMLRSKGYGSLLEASGFSYADKDSNMIIFADDRACRQQLRFTIAHELGHIFLGHMNLNVPRNQLLLPSDPKLEEDADSFALRLLTPACALWALGVYAPSKIADLCDIPIKQARKRSRRMHHLLQQNKWLTDPKERQLFQQMGFTRPDGVPPEAGT